VDLVCDYTREIVKNAVVRKPIVLVESLDRYEEEIVEKVGDLDRATIAPLLQLSDFENIRWEEVMAGKHKASSYLIRKGLSRKAQLSLQMRRYLSKHRESILSSAVPYTIIVETWGAFEEIRLDFGRGTFASFDTSKLLASTPLRQRLDFCLQDAKGDFSDPSRSDWIWILKPSVTNKGADISVLRDWDAVLDALEQVPDIREWVLQRYIERPLLVSGHKFHLRVYTLATGALKVYCFDRILMLLAARQYDVNDLDDIYKHLTNTARSAEEASFDEEKFVMLLDDLPAHLPSDHPMPAQVVPTIISHVHQIIHDLFSAFENEYTVFSPMSNCFELYGLDFLVDQTFGLHLLEINPGPDFKQTGNRLSTGKKCTKHTQHHKHSN